jgi:hypothetical protein
MKSGVQKGVILMVDERFLEEIDAAYPKLGYSDRASFIRDAVYQLMKEGGYKLPLEYKAAPSRKGKGGNPKHSPIRAVPGTGKEQGTKAG